MNHKMLFVKLGTATVITAFSKITRRTIQAVGALEEIRAVKPHIPSANEVYDNEGVGIGQREYPEVTGRTLLLARFRHPVVVTEIPEAVFHTELVGIESAQALAAIAIRSIKPGTIRAYHVVTPDAIQSDFEFGIAGIRHNLVALIGNVAAGFDTLPVAEFAHEIFSRIAILLVQRTIGIAGLGLAFRIVFACNAFTRRNETAIKILIVDSTFFHPSVQADIFFP